MNNLNYIRKLAGLAPLNESLDGYVMTTKEPVEEAMEIPCPKCQGESDIDCPRCEGAGVVMMEAGIDKKDDNYDDEYDYEYDYDDGDDIGADAWAESIEENEFDDEDDFASDDDAMVDFDDSDDDEFSFGDGEIEVELPQADTRSEVIDVDGMIDAILSTTDKYAEETLYALPTSSIERIYAKVAPQTSDSNEPQVDSEISDMMRKLGINNDVEEDADLQNGYKVYDFYKDDLFPSGDATNVTNHAGPASAKHGDNPLQKDKFTEEQSEDKIYNKLSEAWKKYKNTDLK